MALNELSSGHIRQNHNAEHSRRILRGAVFEGKDDRLQNENTPLAASSVRGMLRNGTETGITGQFSIKPPRVPFSALRAQTGLPLQAHQASTSPQHLSPRHYYPPDAKDQRAMRSENLDPNLSQFRKGIYNSSSRGPSVNRTKDYCVDGIRSYSMTQSSFFSHSLTKRHPYVHTSRSQGRGTVQNVRPRSPFAYPVRLKRPGYRPSSPALSDLSRSIPGSDTDQRSYRTASPASMHFGNGFTTPWQANNNHSEPLLPFCHQASPFQHANGPRPTKSLRSTRSSSKLSYAQAMDDPMWSQPPHQTQPNVFYDYTEGFEEQAHLHQMSVSVARHSYPHHATSDVGTLEESVDHHEVSYIADLPSEVGIVQKMERGMNQEDQHSVCTCHGKGPLRVSAELVHRADSPQAASEHQNDYENGSPVMYSDLRLQEHGFESKRSSGKEVDYQQVKIHEKTDSVAPRTDTSIPEDTHETKHMPLPSAVSHVSAQSITSPGLQGGDDRSMNGSGTDPAELQGQATTPATLRRLSRQSIISEGMKVSENSNILTDSLDIVAPTPERSRNSTSIRERFSKILSIDEGLSEIDDIAASSTQRLSIAGAVGNSIQVLHNNTCTDTSAFDRNEIGPGTDSFSDDEGEKALSKGLMDTFCKSEESPPLNGDNGDKGDKNMPSGSAKNLHLSVTEKEDSPRAKLTPASIRLSHRKTSIIQGLRPTDVSTENESVITDIEKHLSTERLCIKSFGPPDHSSEIELPFNFTPVVQAEKRPLLSQTESPRSSPKQNNGRTSWEIPNMSNPTMEPDRSSSCSPLDSRPWNLDASYPWSETAPSLDVVMPLPNDTVDTSPQRGLPRFKLRIHRASSSTGGTGKLIKRNRSSEETSSSALDLSVDRIPSVSFRHKVKPALSAPPGQNNSSHDIISSNPMQTRFVESFNFPSQTSPIITLVPPSPGYEVRSFFSDDSSQAHPKGSLRKRLSEFRSRHSRAGSGDARPGYDRGLFSSNFGVSRASGRSSRQSQDTSNTRLRKTRMERMRRTVRKIRFWVLHREGNIPRWKRKRQDKTPNSPESATPI